MGQEEEKGALPFNKLIWSCPCPQTIKQIRTPPEV